MTHDQKGSANVIILLVLSVFLLVVSVIFGVWAYGSRQDYKNNVAQKVSVAVATAKQQTEAVDSTQNALANEKPLATYNGPQAFGSIVIKYPKTWSGYVAEDDTSQTPIDGYFNPGVVPNVDGASSVFALRLQVIEQPYATEVTAFTQQDQQQAVKITPYALPSNPKVIGVLINGQFMPNDQNGNSITGSMVILPLLNSTIELWTESPQFESDFTTNILPNFDFSQ